MPFDRKGDAETGGGVGIILGFSRCVIGTLTSDESITSGGGGDGQKAAGLAGDRAGRSSSSSM